MSTMLYVIIGDLLIPVMVSIFMVFGMQIIKKVVDKKNLIQLVTITIKAVEQYQNEEDGYTKKEAVKDYILSKTDIEEDDLSILIESIIYDIYNINLKNL